jgi:MscS family membrane protein
MIVSYRGIRASWLAWVLMVGVVCGLAVAAQTSRAQSAPVASEAAAEAPSEDTPRSSVERFLALARSGRYAEAAKYLELPVSDAGRGPQLAQRLKSVLDRHAWIKLASLSAAPGGDPDDGLPQGVDEIAKVPIEAGVREPVRLVRRGPADARWVFSRVTVQRVDAWYSSLPHRWLLELAPEPLLRMGPGSMLWAQWAALPVFLLVVWTCGVGLSRASRSLLARIAQRTATRWDDALLTRLASPITFGWTLVVAQFLTPLLGLYEPAQHFTERTIRALLFATFFWALARLVDVAGQMFAEAQWGHGSPATRALLLFGSRIGKTFVAALALVALFSELGYPVASLIAGLGVGGIAVALAAQKSLENLIGAFALAVDQPFREGDFVRIDDLLGNVETIGIRSTRIRTLDRTLVSIPNGKLADMRLETFAARDRIRMAFTFGLSYATTEPQMRNVLDGSERLLRGHVKIWPDGVSVRFKEFGESALIVEVGAYFRTADFNEFTLIRQDLLLQFMAVVESAGTSFAFPRRTVELIERRPEARVDSPAHEPRG